MYCAELALQAPVCVEAADSTWALALWRLPHRLWNGSISCAWAWTCEAIKFSCREHFTGSTGIVHELEVRGLVVAPQMLTQLICSNRKVAGAWAGLSAWYLLGPLVE